MAEPFLERYVDRYGEDAALVGTVVALGWRGESFDRAVYGNEIVEALFYRVPNSTLIVNRVETNDQYGESRTFTVLDEDDPLFQIGSSGQLEFNHLTLTQAELLQTAQREGASALLVQESYFQVDIAQGLTNEGEAQARAILSQGDAITPEIVTSLNDLMVVEEEIRRQDQAAQGLSGEVRYPRFTENQLNASLSLDTIARQLSAQSPVVDVQQVLSAALAQIEAQRPTSVEREIEQEFAQRVGQYERTNQLSQTLSLDQRRSQVEVQQPPVAGYESDLNPQLTTKEANVMVAVQEAPVQAQTEIDLRDLMSVKTLDTMETGKVPRQRAEVDGKPQLVDRTPQEGLAMVARAAYGAQNFCQENNLPHSPATEAIATAADRLSLNGSEVTAVLATIEKEQCRPVMEVATKSQAGVWARIEEKYPEYAAKVPDAIKVERSMAQPAADVKATVEEATTRQVPPPKLKQREAAAQLPSQAEMAVTVAAYRLKEAGVDRWGHDNDKATLIFNKSKEGNISVIDKGTDAVIATRNGVTSQVQGEVPPAMDFTKAYAAVVEAQTQKYSKETKTTAPKVKAKAGDGR